MRNARKSQYIGNFVGIECLNVVFFGDNTNGVGITKSVSHPWPLVAGICRTACVTFLSARRGDLPHCVRHIPSRSPRGPLGFAALRASHPSPLAAGALAKLWEIKELRGWGRYSVYAQCLTKASF